MTQAVNGRDIVMRFGEAMNNRNLDALDEIVAPDFVRHCQATPWVNVRGREDFKQFLRDDWQGVPDNKVFPRIVVVEGEYVAFFNTYSGTQTGQWGPLPPSGKRVEIDIAGVVRIAEGKIAEMWVTWDNVTLLNQLGLAPPAAATSTQTSTS